MKSLRGLTLLLSFVIIILNTSVALASIEVAIYDPTPWAYWVATGPFSGTVHISAKATSTFTVSGVTAQVDGRSLPLTYSATAICGHLAGTCSGGWEGTMDLTSLAEGTKNLTVTALDGYGNTGSATAQFAIDGKPTVTVTSPSGNNVITNPASIRLAATCSDVMGSCTGMNVVLTANGSVVASGTTSIDQTFSLANYSGYSLIFRFSGQDSAGQTSTVSRGVYVETSPRLNRLWDVPGIVWDYGADGRVLHLDTSNGVGSLKVKNIITGVTTDIYGNASTGFLTPSGAVFSVGLGLYEWRNGVVSGLGALVSSNGFAVKGNYALWSSDSYNTLVLRNMAAGTNVTVSSTAGNNQNDVDADGNVAFWDNQFNIKKYSSGIITQIATNGVYPLIDGDCIVYTKRASGSNGGISMYTLATGEISLTPAVPSTINPSYSPQYKVSNGWVAYNKPSPDGTSQIWLRSPDGVTRQVTFFGTSSNIVSLAPTGELIISNGSSARLYAYRTSSGLTELSTALPKPLFTNDQWYARIAGALFSFDTAPVVTHPSITNFSIPPAADSATVQVLAFDVANSLSVTGYMITETATQPLSGGNGWQSMVPTSYTFSGIPPESSVTKTLYAWVKDGSGTVSGIVSASVTITLPDTTLPIITSFSIPRNSFELTVPVTFTATDNIGVIDWCLTETNNPGTCTWYQAPPANYTFSGLVYNKNLYAYVRDAAQNMSSPAGAAISVYPAYSVVPTAGFGGIILPNTTQKVAASPGISTSVTFSVRPVPGYHVASVTGCGGTLSGIIYTIGSITANCFVTARFEKSDAIFSEKAYLAANADIAVAIRKGLYGITSGWDHYSRGGKTEGRRLEPVSFNLFNEDAYLAANPNVIPLVKNGQIASAWHHYTCGGIGEGRNLQPEGYATFNEDAYLAANLDVAEALRKGLYGISSGWDHYVKSGKTEGRAIRPNGYGDFNEAAYLAANPDVDTAIRSGQIINGWQHYSSSGRLEGRQLQPSAYSVFNENAYLAANKDIADALRNGLYGITSGWDHYSRGGQGEKRRIEPISYCSFNEEAYLSANPDVAAAIKAGQIVSGWHHYTCGGVLEGRKLEPTDYAVFSETPYLAANPDVVAAIKAGQITNGWQHYANSGKAEGRHLTPAGYGRFNEEAYLMANPDVSQAIKAGQINSGWQHYISSGLSEGRSLYPQGYILFNEASYLAANPIVAAAVKVGQFSSGWDHYIKYGQAAGLPMEPAGYGTFSDYAYLGANPAVATAVYAAQFSTGWEHYNKWGRAGGLPVGADNYGGFSEADYLAANTDIYLALIRGQYDIHSGWDHYQRGGRLEGRRLAP